MKMAQMAHVIVNETSALSCIQHLGVVDALTFPEYQRSCVVHARLQLMVYMLSWATD